MESKHLKYQRAKERVVELRAFYKNVRNILIFFIIFGAINYFSNGLSYPWFLWIIGAMSIGLGIDAFRTFIAHSFMRRWERKKIESLLHDDTF